MMTCIVSDRDVVKAGMPRNDPEAGGPSRRGGVRDRMIDGAVRLLATRGVEGTSFAEVLDLTSTPRGSVYYHFPGGKSELVHAAMDLASERAIAGMDAAAGDPVVSVVRRFLGLWRDLLDASDLTAGCAVVAVTVATQEDELLDHAGAIFRSWTELFVGFFVADGLERVSARRLAVTVIAAAEGAVALCRAERSRKPFDDVSTSLVALSEHVVTSTR
jgi:TetR/AcrR family transcriptional repressor of lmrAB and yxaGH operons